jgi:hypothetical protein
MSRRPLGPGEITALIGVAVSLHSAAVEQVKARQWWVPIAIALVSFAGGIGAVVLGKWL